ncbi:MAG: hypothetical protein LBK65_01150 [Tannerellaceae bacterium]|jgi:hypothetical protein|nr:hypothetical protein [Tannerellaceae bacterium]
MIVGIIVAIVLLALVALVASKDPNIKTEPPRTFKDCPFFKTFFPNGM